MPAQAGDSHRFKFKQSGLIGILAALVSGPLLTLAFSPFDFSFVAWFALAPFLWSVRNVRPRSAAFRGYIFGMAYFAALFWWITKVRYPASLGYFGGVILLPAIFFVPWALAANRLEKSESQFVRIWAPAFLWVMIEWVTAHGMFGFPWWALGNSQSKNLVIAQSASIGSIYIISFMIVIVNRFLVSCAQKRLKTEATSWAAAAAIIILAIVYGAISLNQSPPSEHPLRISLIQANFSQDEKIATVQLGEMFTSHFRMTEEAVAESRPDMVVWPETISPIFWFTGPGNMEATKTRLKQLGITLVAGVYNWSGDGKKNYNSVIAVDPDKGLLGSYSKIHVVPFGETFPYRRFFERVSPALGEWIRKTVYEDEDDLSPGTKYTVFRSRNGKFGTLICFESIFPQMTRRMVLDGAEYIIVITNDAWFMDTPGTYQHASMAAFRAIENRKYVVQAANSGISTIIDPLGKVIDKTPVLEKTVLTGSIYPNNEKTFYSRFGDVFAALCAILFAAAVLSAILMKKESSTDPSKK